MERGGWRYGEDGVWSSGMAPEAVACLRLEAETRLASTVVHEPVVQQCGPACGTALACLFWGAVQQEQDPLELAWQELKGGPAAVAGSLIVVKVVSASVLTLHPSEDRRMGHNFTARSRDTLQRVGWPRQLRMRGVVCWQTDA